MSRRTKKRLSLDPVDLQEIIARDKKEIEQVRGELKRLGNDLKREHMQEMLHPGMITLTRDREDPQFNRMCRKCLNSCKQTESVKIFFCAKYAPVD